MGTGYTRNDTPNNIADGNVINASDLDGEFDAIQTAFNGSTGHSHDGTTGEGPQIATGGLADNAVTTAKITDANVTLAKMAANSVDSDQYVDGSIDRVHLAADIVDGTKIADDSIDSEHYVDGSIDTAHIADDAVTSAKLDTNIQIAGTLGVTGVSSFADGSNSAPSISFTSDTNTGIYRGGTDILKFVTAGTDAVTIDASQNVGIGTITPNTTNLNSGTTSGIVVKSGGVAKNNFVALPSTGGSQWDVRESGGSGGEFTMRMFDTSGSQNVQISSNGNHFFNGGNVGIGTSSPNRDLSVAGVISAQTSANDASILLLPTASENRIYSRAGDASSTALDLTFRMGDTERMRIDSSGNVGIGTDSPSQKLDVNGTIVASTTSSQGARIERNGTTGGANFDSVLASGSLHFRTGTTERMRIDSSGNLLIGQTDSNARLASTSTTNKQLSLRYTGVASYYTSVDSSGNYIIDKDGSERMRIDSNGNLNVGVPTADTSSNNISITGGLAGSQLNAQLKFFGKSVSNTGVTYETARISGGSTSGAYSLSGGLVFSTSSNNGSNVLTLAERMRIDSTGSVGIGETVPLGKLHIKEGDSGVTSVSTDADQLVIENNAESGISILAPTNSASRIAFGDSDNNKIGQIYYNHTSNFMKFDVNNAERMRITEDGAMTMGTTTSQTAVSGITLKNDVQSGFPTLLFLQNQPGTGGTMGAQIHMGYASDYGSILRFTGDPFSARPGGFQFRRVTGSGTSDLSMEINSSGAVTVTGSLSKGSGSFRIDHPLPEKNSTHKLVHSFIEGPQADLIYRGKVELIAGSATVNIDTASSMTEGTFVLLCDDVQCFTSNEDGFTAVKGSVLGNTLTITAEDNTCTDTISWMVVGERKDQHMLDTEWTDNNGKVIVEPLKEETA